jgi:hypothetical protein
LHWTSLLASPPASAWRFVGRRGACLKQHIVVDYKLKKAIRSGRTIKNCIVRNNEQT